MKEVIALILLFVVVGVAIYSGLGALQTIDYVNTNGCAYNSTGYLENCSLSNAQYDQFNKTTTSFAYMFQTLGVIQWIGIALILIAALLLFVKYVK
jgi:hypothetical protein